MDLVSAWTALDDATHENGPQPYYPLWTRAFISKLSLAVLGSGCLEFARGTHRWGIVPPAAREQLTPELERERSGEPAADRSWSPQVVRVPMRAGSVSFHHSLILHMSGPNLSDQRRRGYAVERIRGVRHRQETAHPLVPESLSTSQRPSPMHGGNHHSATA